MLKFMKKKKVYKGSFCTKITMSSSINRSDGSDYVEGEQFATDGLARWEPYLAS